MRTIQTWVRWKYNIQRNVCICMKKKTRARTIIRNAFNDLAQVLRSFCICFFCCKRILLFIASISVQYHIIQCILVCVLIIYYMFISFSFLCVVPHSSTFLTSAHSLCFIVLLIQFLTYEEIKILIQLHPNM